MSDDLTALIEDCEEFPKHLGKNVESALKVTAFKMKDSWQNLAKIPSGTHAAHYPPSIDYDITKSEFPHYQAEIGPNISRYGGKTGKGGLAPGLGILEEAPGGVRAAPQNLRPKVVKANEADYARGLHRAVGDALKEVQL